MPRHPKSLDGKVSYRSRTPERVRVKRERKLAEECAKPEKRLTRAPGPCHGGSGESCPPLEKKDTPDFPLGTGSRRKTTVNSP